jgi:hypothetical protein
MADITTPMNGDGAGGVTFATPFIVVIIVLVKMLYVEDVLGDEASMPGKT